MPEQGRSDAPGEALRTHQQRVAELEQRIAEMEALEDAAFGAFTARDWWACVIGAVVLPALALWWFAR
jgi:hypothetical protein